MHGARGYSLSETSPVASFNMPDRERKPGRSAWRSRAARCVNGTSRAGGAVGEVGEIAIRGDNVMKGYWNKPEATAEAIPDNWFRTGDLATMDDEGYFTIVDRKKDMILRGGMNVYPREVEELLYTHPDVLEAAVVGMPDELLGEQVGAAVALRPGATVTPRRLSSGPGADRGLVPAPGLDRQRVAQGADRQDPASRGARARGG